MTRTPKAGSIGTERKIVKIPVPEPASVPAPDPAPAAEPVKAPAEPVPAGTP